MTNEDPGPEPGEVTRLLIAWNAGDPSAVEKLMPLVAHPYTRCGACNSCDVASICDGFHGDYGELFSFDEAKPIKLGRNLGTEVEVVQGLNLSDRLVNSPPDSLATGDKVRVAGAPQEGAAEQQTRQSGREENAAEAKPH